MTETLSGSMMGVTGNELAGYDSATKTPRVVRPSSWSLTGFPPSTLDRVSGHDTCTWNLTSHSHSTQHSATFKTWLGDRTRLVSDFSPGFLCTSKLTPTSYKWSRQCQWDSLQFHPQQIFYRTFGRNNRSLIQCKPKTFKIFPRTPSM